MLSEHLKNYNIIAVIPARGGSKGVPRKALQMLGDIPLIAYTIRDALSIQNITKVFVSTDDLEIQAVSIEYGAEVPFLRPSELAQDNSMLEDALKYSLGWYRDHERFIPDIEIIMSPTHPFRRQNLINDALKRGIDNPDIFNLGSVSPVKVMPGNYWIKKNKTFQRFQFPVTGSPGQRPVYQSAFSFNIVFDCRPDLVNRRIPIALNEIESIDIDEPDDFEIARMVISKGLYPFHE
ncbi:MAG: acylneuraminate cytidylyltransferase family protein [Deltaproteobacteria bacterium]|nr:acylneuraminate cytidylyltransferase family protein [Deltaproteobacteria bacterium]